MSFGASITMDDEIPSDEDVLAMIAQNDGKISLAELIKLLQAENHSRFNAQRAVLRVIDRRKIGYNIDFELEARQVRELVS